jgi:hypothetical protein
VGFRLEALVLNIAAAGYSCGTLRMYSLYAIGEVPLADWLIFAIQRFLVQRIYVFSFNTPVLHHSRAETFKKILTTFKSTYC